MFPFTLSVQAIAVLSAVLAAIANIMARTLLKNTSAKQMLPVNFMTMGLTLVLLSPLFYFFEATLISMALVVLVGVIDTAANYFYFKTFEKSEVSLATPLLSLAPAFTFLFGWVAINDTASMRSLIVAALILLGVVVFSWDVSNFKSFKANTLIPALAASILFGASAIPAKFLLSNLEVINAPTLYMFRAGFIALFSLLAFDFQVSTFSSRDFRFLFIRSLFVIGQWILLYTAVTHLNAGVSLTLANITPIFVFFLGVLFLKEKPSWKKLVSAMLILVLSFFL